MSKIKNIVITGFMGTGKTSVGREVAHLSERRFFDTDRLIQAQAGISIEDIFKIYGEKHFRDMEKRVVKSIFVEENAVIATGGGTLLDPDNLHYMSMTGVTFCLYSRVDVLIQRLKESKKRPLLDGGDPRRTIEELLLERGPAYRQFPHRLDTSDSTPAETAMKIIDHYRKIVRD